MMARLEDRYGTYGHIGLTLVACGEEVWTLKLMLMSCRVMSRGVGSIMLSHVMNMAKDAGVRLQAEFVPTDRNRMMDITYRFAGFREVERVNNLVIFEHDLTNIQPYPNYVKFHITDGKPF
jgi:FkbH-like protein